MKRLLFVTAMGVIAFGCSAADPDPPSSTSQALPLSAVAQIESLLAEKAARTPAQKKISSQLLYAKSGRFQSGIAKTGGSGLTSLMRYDDSGRALVDIKGDIAAGVKDRVENLGGTVVDSTTSHGSVRAWIGLDRVEELAAESSVQAIRPALPAMTWRADSPITGAKSAGTRAQRVAAVQKAVREVLPISVHEDSRGVVNVGAATSEGDKAHGAERARKFFNADGTGIRVGVLSDSDDFKEQAIASGDLPPDTVTVPGQDGRPGTGEGTAMMEIVHDVAPGAKIFFASAFNSPESFADNIRILREVYHCDIILDDVIYFFESPYQDDIVAAAVDDVTADGAMYFSSAGNEGNFNDGTSGTWEGDFKSGGTLATLPSGYVVQDFGAGVISNRVDLAGGPLALHWSDPGSLDNPKSSNDYDLFILDEDLRNVLAASTDVQDGDDLAFEFLDFFIPENLRIVVAKHPNAKTRAVRVVLFGGELGLNTPGSAYGHNSAQDAFAIAAVDAAEAGGGEFMAGPTTPVELFSSDGPRRIFYDRNGHALSGGVTFASGGGVDRQKPDLTGADGVSTTLPSGSGLNPFFGTSAAAPHVGAIAALIKSAVPNASTTKVRNALVNGALDIEAKKTDRDSGAGIVSAFNSLQKAGAQPAVFIDLGAVTATPTSGDAILPGGSGQITVELLNNGGATATNVNAHLVVGSPFLTLTRANASYGTIAPGASATNAQPFLFSVDPATPCGARLAFTMLVTFTGRGTSPTLFTFSIQTGRPSPTGENFAYGGAPVEIPDDDPAGVDVPLSVSSIGALSKVVFHIDGTACTTDEGATTVGVDHTFVSDLVFKLSSPSGKTVTLINEIDLDGNNFCQTVLDDGATDPIQDAEDAPFTGTFTPANPLAAFNGETADGTWVLNVSDNFFFDTGNVRAFSVDVFGFTCTP